VEDNKKGDLAEIKVQSDLVAKDMRVSIPVHEIEYDIVAEEDGNFYRIQVKTGTYRSDRDSIECNILRSGRDYGSGEQRKYSSDSFDILAMWCQPIDTVCYVEWNEPRTSYSVRENLDDVANRGHHRVNLVEDQTLDSAIKRLK
jgi:hypothetical protein